jgi:hypothetical protein
MLLQEVLAANVVPFFLFLKHNFALLLLHICLSFFETVSILSQIGDLPLDIIPNKIT